MPNPPIRTITLGIADPHPLTSEVIKRAAARLQQASTRYTEAGYEVQTVRLSTRPVFDDLAGWSSGALMKYADELQRMLDGVGLEFCSLGTAQVARPDFPLERLDLIADILAPRNALSATVQLATTEYGLPTEAALPTAHIMKRLASETEEGFGNFRFAMLACVAAGCPFFPSAYHAGASSLSIGLQGAGVVVEALGSHRDGEGGPIDPTHISEWVRTAIIEQAAPVVNIGQALAQEQGVSFGGIDLSPAPMGEDSIAAAMELCGYGLLGSMGTVAVAAAITSALKSTTLPTCGYCGLMLPVLEDAVLGKRWEQEMVGAQKLLLYSAVCGTGLDTLPLAGDTPAEIIAYLLLDVAAFALRLNKQLSARLFPVPGKSAGERTAFTSPYLTNTVVR